MATYSFGSGVLIGQRNDTAIDGNTPYNIGLIQDVTIDLGYTTKMLYGQNQFPLAIGRGTAKFTGKAKTARISGGALASLMFGLNPTFGAQSAITIYLEGTTASGTPIPTTPFQITVTGGATFVDDLGVIDAASGLPYTRVLQAATPIAGQYKVSNAGVYTFSSADNVSGNKVFISYNKSVAASGMNWTQNNPLLGYAPTFQLTFYETFQGNPITIKFLQVIGSKFALPTKLEDFTYPEWDFEMMANAAGNVYTWSQNESDQAL